MIARIITFFFLLIVIGGLTGAAYFLVEPPAQYIQGEVEATKVNVSAKIPGRVEEMLVEEGQTVEKGELLAILDSPQLQAKRQQANAAKQAASAQERKAEYGARDEEIRMAHNKWLQAQAGAEFAQKSFARIERLYQDGVVPEQQRDEVESKMKMAKKLEAAARAQYDMAQTGARVEDKDAASALVAQASGAVSEVDSLIEESKVCAPIGGEVLEHVVNLGELASAGMPIVTMIDMNDIWVTFNVREDNLPGMKIGGTLKASIPALALNDVELEITYIAALGDFAMWRATSASGGFDLRTFEVRARLKQPIEDLRPGMSVLVPWKLR